MNSYPYYILPDIKALKKGGLTTEEELWHKRKIAANMGDTTFLRITLGIDPEEFASFYPDLQKASMGTNDTIDSFLDRFGTGIPADEKNVSYRIEEGPEEKGMKEEKREEERDSNQFKSLVKNKRYSEALQIITSQSLKNPEKSAYFADQIRFLKKLILNEAYLRNSPES